MTNIMRFINLQEAADDEEDETVETDAPAAAVDPSSTEPAEQRTLNDLLNTNGPADHRPNTSHTARSTPSEPQPSTSRDVTDTIPFNANSLAATTQPIVDNISNSDIPRHKTNEIVADLSSKSSPGVSVETAAQETNTSQQGTISDMDHDGLTGTDVLPPDDTQMNDKCDEHLNQLD